MAKIEIQHSEIEYLSGTTEVLEVRVWGRACSEGQVFYIGSGANFKGDANLWLEIIYTVEGAQIFYTRNFVYNFSDHSLEENEARLEKILQEGKGVIAFGDMMPETSVLFNVEPLEYEGFDGNKVTSTTCKLEITADTGTVFGHSSPGERIITISLPQIELDEGVRFMRDFMREVENAREGKHPNPSDFPPESSEWPFIEQLNRKAYNLIAEDYTENYFELPLLAKAFEDWMSRLPSGGLVLDAGCGHGQPVIDKLLEHGFQVTGSDFSPKMLERAAQQFPCVRFVQQPTYKLDLQEAFDGICSFNSVVYLDVIDFLNSVQRLHNALKPRGWLFLYGYDSGPGWRGLPFDFEVGQWMWAWHYSPEEVTQLLEEHGHFEVVDSYQVFVQEKSEEPAEAEVESQEQETEEEDSSELLEQNPIMPDESSESRPNYSYVVIARRRN